MPIYIIFVFVSFDPAFSVWRDGFVVKTFCGDGKCKPIDDVEGKDGEEEFERRIFGCESIGLARFCGRCGGFGDVRRRG